MALITVDSISAATASGWMVQQSVGSTSAYYAEKPVQCGGKLIACGADSASLVNAMQAVENNQFSFGTHGPEDTSFPGHV